MKKINIIIILINLVVLSFAAIYIYQKKEIIAENVLFAKRVSSITSINDLNSINNPFNLDFAINTVGEKNTILMSSKNEKDFKNNFFNLQHVMIELRRQIKMENIISAELVNINDYKKKLKTSDCLEIKNLCGIKIEKVLK